MPSPITADDWLPRQVQEARLRALDARLAGANDGSDPAATDPNAIELRVERAALLNVLGRPEEARKAYLDVLARAPNHFAALNDFGVMLCVSGFRSAARTLYLRAVAQHPGNPKGHVNLANLLTRDGKVAAARGDESAARDLAAARDHYEIALQLDPGLPQAHQGLGAVLAELSDPDGAAAHRRKGYEGHSITTLPYRGTRPPLPLLVLASAVGGDIPTASFLDDRVFLTHVVVADFCDPAAPLPPHQADLQRGWGRRPMREALAAAAALIKKSAAPVINLPAVVSATGRIANATRLGALPGVVAPRMVALPRAALDPAGRHIHAGASRLHLSAAAALARFHTGRHFVQVQSADDLVAGGRGTAGRRLAGDRLSRRARRDGIARKYRVMIVDGELYPLHLAISRHWKVHYFTADMADDPDHRARGRGVSQRHAEGGSAARRWRRSSGFATRSASIMPASTLASVPTAKCCCSRPMPRWWSIRPIRTRAGLSPPRGRARSRCCSCHADRPRPSILKHDPRNEAGFRKRSCSNNKL